MKIQQHRKLTDPQILCLIQQQDFREYFRWKQAKFPQGGFSDMPATILKSKTMNILILHLYRIFELKKTLVEKTISA